MFQKPHSSTHSRGKKCKDVPLRKSDRRILRRLVGDCFLTDELQRLDNQDGNNSEPMKQSVPLISQLLDHVFLQGTLVSRTIELPPPAISSSSSSVHHYYKTCTLYYRSPDIGEQDNQRKDALTAIWPYTKHAQCVWIQVLEQDLQRKSQTMIHQLPALALLSVLPSPYIQFGQVLLNNASVSEYLCRGAHLMRAGMRLLTSPQDLLDSMAVLIYVRNNPQPMAVGLLMEMTEAQQANAGVGVHIVSCYGDDIWKQQSFGNSTNTSIGASSSLATNGPKNDLLGGGAPYNDGHYGNAGFCDGKFVVPILVNEQSDESNAEDNNSEVEDDPPSAGLLSDEPLSQGVQGDAVDTSEVESVLDHTRIEASVNEFDNVQPLHQVATNQASPHHGSSMSVSNDETATPTLPPDDVLHAAVCKALSTLQAKRDLPMTMAKFYSQHVLPNRPEGSHIELKQTKWKKFGAYVKEQVTEGLLMVGPDASKKDPMAMLVGFDASQDTSIKSYRQQAKLPGIDNASTNTTLKVVVSDLYMVPPPIVKLLRLDPDVVKAADATSDERRNTGMLTMKEARAILDEYLQRENLITSDRPGYANMDGPLLDVLYGKQKKQDAPTILSRPELTTRWLSKLEPAYALVQVPGNRVLTLARGKPPNVRITVTCRQNRKFVTRVRGMEDYGIHAASFCTDVSRRFACSGAIEEEPSEALKKDHVELQFQGNLAEELEALLTGDASLTSHGGAQNSDYRVPKCCVEVIRRKGVPARKKRTG
ncbi:hypothetical protein MPSEU_000583700 [Mayamaea pseudoterrestris]|nr:hypothetical protein MPSEU_000583700 [Mayamaea pseudoterrestris]